MTSFARFLDDRVMDARWWRDTDGAFATTLNDEADSVPVPWDVSGLLVGAETVSSAAYSDQGTTTSGKSVTSPEVRFTIAGYGETEVVATTSTGRKITRVFRVYPTKDNPVFHKDYR